MEESRNCGKTVFAFKGNIPLKDRNRFDVIGGFVPDEMHCVSLGVCRQFSDLYFNSTGNPYSVKKKKYIKDVEDILRAIKFPTVIGRPQRSLKERKFWKAHEWEHWLLFVSLIILRGIPGFKKYADHWQLLVEAMYIMKKDVISHAD